MLTRNIGIFISCIILVAFASVLQATAATEEEMMAARQGMIDAINAHDVAQMKLYFTDDIVYEFVAQPPPMNGKEELAAFFEGIFQGIPDFHGTQTRALVSGNIMVTESMVTGTHLGEFSGIPATGNSIQGSVLHIWEFQEDLVKHVTEYLDMASVMVQLGVMPAPELDTALLVPSFALPDAEPTGLSPIEAQAEGISRLNTHDLSLYAKIIQPDAETIIGGVPMGRDAEVAMEELYLLAFSDLHTDLVRSIDMGDGWVINELVFTGTNDGPYMGIPATGNSIMLRAGSLTRFDADGLLTNLNLYFDNLTMMAQLGLLAPESNTEANKAIARRIYDEVWNQQNLDLIDELAAPDLIVHNPPTADANGPEAYKAMIAGYLAAFPDTQWTIEDEIASGELVTFRMTGTGSHQGEFMGIPPSDMQMTVVMITTVRIVDGKIVEGWSNADQLGLMQQLGVMPPTREDYTWGIPSEITGDPGDPQTNVAAIQSIFSEVFVNGNLDAIDESFAPEFIMHDPVVPMEILGPEGYKQVNGMYFIAFPDIQITADDMVAEGDEVAIRWTLNGTQTGEFMGIPATGRRITTTGISIYRFADGKVVEIWASYDALGMMQQLTMSQEEYNKAIANRIFDEIWNQGNLDVADEVLAADLARYDAGNPSSSGMVGAEGFKQLVATYRAAFPDIHFAYNDLIAEGDMVVGRWTSNGTHQGELMGIPATGLVVTGTGISILRIAENKVVEEWVEWDSMGMMQQLGIADPSGREDFSWGTPSEIAGEPGDPEANKAIFMRYAEEVWNQQNLDVLEEIMSVDVNSHEGTTGHLFLPGIDSERQSISLYIAAFPDLHVNIDDLIAEGDKVVQRWTATGTHQGDLMDIPASGKSITFTGITIYRFADGKIVELWWAWDTMGLMQQITPPPEGYDNVFFMNLSSGLNMISLPLEPIDPHTARSFAEEIGATVVIKYDTMIGRFVGFTPAAPDDGFSIEGGQGYIVNVLTDRTVQFIGAAWTNEPPVEMAPSAQTSTGWAFVVSGSVLDGEGMSAADEGYTAIVRNLRTDQTLTEAVAPSGYFALASADLSRKTIISAGDKVEVAVLDSNGELASGPFIHNVTPDEIRDAVVKIDLKLGEIIPERSALLQNYPNPFNPETWIPFHLHDADEVSIEIYNSTGKLIRTLALGFRDAGIHTSRSKAAYWDGKNEAGESVASGIYFYTIQAGEFTATRKLTITK